MAKIVSVCNAVSQTSKGMWTSCLGVQCGVPNSKRKWPKLSRCAVLSPKPQREMAKSSRCAVRSPKSQRECGQVVLACSVVSQTPKQKWTEMCLGAQCCVPNHKGEEVVLVCCAESQTPKREMAKVVLVCCAESQTPKREMAKLSWLAFALTPGFRTLHAACNFRQGVLGGCAGQALCPVC